MLLFAIGLFLLSFVSAWYFKVQPSTNFHQRILQKYVDEQHKEAAATLSNNELMRKLVIRGESVEEFQELAKKGFGLFLFAETISDNQALLFWNTQKILPPQADFKRPDGEYFEKLANGYYIV